MRINGARLKESLLEMARIGATPGGGVSRVALTDADREGRDLFARWLREAGLELSVDEMGNMFGRRRGKDPSLPPVLFGSHLDSVPQGGKFDGALGVLAALEVARTLNEGRIETRHPLELVNFTNEEGARSAGSAKSSASPLFYPEWSAGASALRSSPADVPPGEPAWIPLGRRGRLPRRPVGTGATAAWRKAMRINGGRLKESLLEMARIGATPGGGVSRVALTDADRDGRELFARWGREAGLELSVDEMGNMFGRRRGKDPSLPPVLFGSHLDSVPQGGKFDGTLGVLTALEVIRTLNDGGIETRHPLEIVNFTNEEGARFQPAMLASGVMAAKFSLEYAYARQDRTGVRFGDELVRIGYQGSVKCAPRPIHAYLEYHIEQGPVLEHDGLAVGVVTGILGIAWARVTLEGERDHAGPTPMPMRHDALVAAAQVVTAARDLARRFGGDMVTTVGCLDVEPNVINVIPGKVTLTVDIRDSVEEQIEQAVRALDSEVERIAKAEGVRVHVERIWRIPPTHFSPDVIRAAEEACGALGYPYRTLMAGAGHDAKYMNDIARTGMIFIRTLHGKSHCEEESATWEDIEQGANVLLHTVLRVSS